MISIVTPCYNEEGNIEELYSHIKNILKGHTYEILFIDDGSKDSTLEKILSLAKKDAAVKYVSFSRNFGHQNALKAGIDHAVGDCIIMMDSDLQHPPDLILQMIEKWKEGYDVVFSVKEEFMSGSIIKTKFSELFYNTVNYLTDIKLEKGAADFRLIDKKVAKVLREDVTEYFLFLRGLISWVGFKQYAIKYTPQNRKHGDSKYSIWKLASLALNGITSFSIKPLRIATLLGILVSSFAFLYGIYALYIKFFTNNAPQGWTALILTVLFIGGIQMILLGIIGEYLGKLFFEIKKRPHYILKETNCTN